jgi:alkanesulfonate monooxygenase
MELGLHITDFTWAGGTPALSSTLARHVQNAEAAGVTRITVMDHFWQIPPVGPAEDSMIEAYTTLGFLAAHTTTARLHTLVTGVIYREPALLAKQVATLDVLSGGRAGLGIGAAWYIDESDGLGFRFPSATERFERLEEAIQICQQMWSPSDAPYVGKHYQLARTLSSPPCLQGQRPYLMIGGMGAKKTLRLVAQYADACNFSVSDEACHKLTVLRRHCDDVGRDYDQIEKTFQMRIDPTTGRDDFIRIATGMRDLGFTTAYVYSSGITEPSKITDLLAAALPKLA